jgi:hypothetical protein
MATTHARSKVMDRPRGWGRGHGSTHVPQYSADKIKETNPRQVDLLWRQVSTTRTSQSESDKNATARDVDFENTQLIPRGIEIQKSRVPSMGYLAGAYAYFGSKMPPNPAESREFYRGIAREFLVGRAERDVNDSIFLSMDDVFIQSVHRSYRVLGQAGLPEAEFKAYACQNLFIGQHDILENDAARRLSAVRSLQWSLKPHEFEWHTPPLLSPDNPPLKPYDFDIYPNCQFWLCDKILNANYRDAVTQLGHCKALDTFCPYFSIEFKAKLESTRTVVN